MCKAICVPAASAAASRKTAACSLVQVTAANQTSILLHLPDSVCYIGPVSKLRSCKHATYNLERRTTPDAREFTTQTSWQIRNSIPADVRPPKRHNSACSNASNNHEIFPAHGDTTANLNLDPCLPLLCMHQCLYYGPSPARIFW